MCGPTTHPTPPPQAHPGALGCAPCSPSSALPFLLKVLSVAKALSVQAHPDRPLAAVLHSARPDLYPDANHKPELALALTPFAALCAFRAPGDLAAQLRATPELCALAGGTNACAPLLDAADAANAAGVSGAAQAAFEAALRSWFSALMAAPDARVCDAVGGLHARLRAGGGAGGGARAPAAPLEHGATALDADAVALELCGQYPGDVGVFAPYLLNAIELAPGTALFLAAGEPHAYLRGDCVEVMACSDNVVRAGLTPKHKDVPTLTAMLTYHARGPPRVLAGEGVEAEGVGGAGKSAGAAAPAGHTRVFRAPVPEFQLQRTAIGASNGAVALPRVASAAILVVISGEGAAVCSPREGGAPLRCVLQEGAIFLQPAGVDVSLEASGSAQLVVFRAAAAEAEGSANAVSA